MDQPPSLHRYLYAFGNPTRFTDPTGRQAEKEEGDPDSGWTWKADLLNAVNAIKSLLGLKDEPKPKDVPKPEQDQLPSQIPAVPRSPGEAVSDLVEGVQKRNALLIDEEEAADVPTPEEVKEAVDAAQAVNDVLQAAQSSRGQDQPVVENQSGPGAEPADDPIGNYDPEAETHSGVVEGQPDRREPSDTAPLKRMNVGPSGHHVPAVRKSRDRPFEVGRSDKTRPTIQSRGSDPGHDHWRMHNAERSTVGPRQGDYPGSDDELFDAYREAYEGLDDIRVDVKSPDGSIVLAEDVTPREAVGIIETWLEEQELR